MTVLRHQLLVDRDVQGLVLRRVALYAVACFIYFTVILFCFKILADPDQAWGDAVMRCLDEMVYWLPGVAILAPVIAYDITRITHRFVGPIFRLRREMMRLAEGQQVDRLGFRAEDYWSELSEVFNQIRDEMLDLRRIKSEREAEPSETRCQQLFEQSGAEDDAGEDEMLVVSED